MSVKYIDIIIENNFFYIKESTKKPHAHHSTIETLKKIEYIVKNKLTYSPTQNDRYSHNNSEELFNSLKEISKKIHHRYKLKKLKFNWIIQKILFKDKPIQAVYNRINHYIKPPSSLPLPAELISRILGALDMSDRLSFGLLNRLSHKQLPSPLKLAKKYGYEGLDLREARLYVESLMKQMDKLQKNGLIPKKFLFSAGKKLNVEAVLQNLKKNLLPEDLPLIFSNRALFSQSYDKFIKLFTLNGYFNKDKRNALSSSNVLLFACDNSNNYQPNSAFIEFLLHHGTSSNQLGENGITPLHLAAYTGDLKIIQLLVNDGAKTDVRVGHYTPLDFAYRGWKARRIHPDRKVIELLEPANHSNNPIYTAPS